MTVEGPANYPRILRFSFGRPFSVHKNKVSVIVARTWTLPNGDFLLEPTPGESWVCWTFLGFLLVPGTLKTLTSWNENNLSLLWFYNQAEAVESSFFNVQGKSLEFLDTNIITWNFQIEFSPLNTVRSRIQLKFCHLHMQHCTFHRRYLACSSLYRKRKVQWKMCIRIHRKLIKWIMHICHSNVSPVVESVVLRWRFVVSSQI